MRTDNVIAGILHFIRFLRVILRITVLFQLQRYTCVCDNIFHTRNSEAKRAFLNGASVARVDFHD